MDERNKPALANGMGADITAKAELAVKILKYLLFQPPVDESIRALDTLYDLTNENPAIAECFSGHEAMFTAVLTQCTNTSPVATATTCEILKNICDASTSFCSRMKEQGTIIALKNSIEHYSNEPVVVSSANLILYAVAQVVEGIENYFVLDLEIHSTSIRAMERLMENDSNNINIANRNALGCCISLLAQILLSGDAATKLVVASRGIGAVLAAADAHAQNYLLQITASCFTALLADNSSLRRLLLDEEDALRVYHRAEETFDEYIAQNPHHAEKQLETIKIVRKYFRPWLVP